MKEKVKAFMKRIAYAIYGCNPKRVCVFKTGTYDVEIVMDGPESALFASGVSGFKFALPTLEELAKLPITYVKYVGDADIENEQWSLQINRNRGTGTLIIVLNTDWRRDLLGVDYINVNDLSVKKMFAAKLTDLTVGVDLNLRKEHLSLLLEASGGLPETGWWRALGDGDTFFVEWRSPDNKLHSRIFSFDTFFEQYPDEEPGEIDYEEV